MDSKNHHHSQYHDSALAHANGAAAAGEKLVAERFELPRIYISLSRKEKEDDFLAMKGSKLPQRPKKRAKNVDKSLQVCIISDRILDCFCSDTELTCVLFVLQFVFPGMWLSDLTRGRYEVREKKCVKKVYRLIPSFHISF
jgi:hypothetical protein